MSTIFKKVIIAGEYYSSNLGDAVIADSVAYLVLQELPESTIEFLDLDGRTAFNATSKPGSSKGMFAGRFRKSTLFKRILALARWHRKDKLRLTSYYTEKLQKADLLIFAGGQLLMDNDLTFPLRIDLLVSITEKLGIPIAFNAVGIQKYARDTYGTRLLRKALGSPAVKFVSTRDSVEFLRNFYLTTSTVPCSATADPAVWSALAYTFTRSTDRKRVGLGVIAPQMYEKFAQRTGDTSLLVSAPELLSYWSQLIEKLTNLGYSVSLFTNGDPADHRFATEVQQVSPNALLSNRPTTPQELLTLISSFSGIIGSRLHTHIVAFSLGIPTLGLLWDKKVAEFAELAQIRDRFYSAHDTEPIPMAQKLDEVLNHDLSASPERLRTLAKESIHDLIQTVSSSPSA